MITATYKFTIMTDQAWDVKADKDIEVTDLFLSALE